MTAIEGGDPGTADGSEAGFQAWLQMMDYQLEMFQTFDMPELPDDPYTPAGLDIAERVTLERFPTLDALNQPGSRELWDRLTRFVGETFARNFGGEWVLAESPKPFFGVKLPFWDPVTPTLGYISMAVNRRSGHEWRKVYENAERAKKRMEEA